MKAYVSSLRWCLEQSAADLSRTLEVTERRDVTAFSCHGRGGGGGGGFNLEALSLSLSLTLLGMGVAILVTESF